MSWQLASFAVLGVVLAAGFGWYERSRPAARVLALVAAVAALAVVGRIAFAAIPNVKPTTDVVLLSGHALGAVPGFAVGAVTALVSNVFFGHGPWTPWQMAAWGGVGVAGGLLACALRGRELGRIALAGICGLAGLGFGAVMDVYQWSFAAEQTLGSYLAIAATSLPYNLAHAIGNVVFCLLFGPAFVRAVARYRRRFEVRWRLPSPAAASALVAVAVAAGALAAAPAADAASATQRALRYLEGAQNRDGGFGGARGQSSSQLFTGWTALGLASADRNPRDVTRKGRSAIDYIRSRARELRDTGELERTILALRASGLSPRRFAGRDLVAELRRRAGRDGSFERQVPFTAFAILALRAADERPGSRTIRKAAEYLTRSQREDGGWGVTPTMESDVDDTGAVLQALAVAGRRGAVPDGVRYLRRAQNRDGGFGQSAGRASNAQSTAWAVQGLVATGHTPDGFAPGGRTPLGYLRSLQARDGSFRYSRASAQTPVWVTAQVLTALEREPFPLEPAPRAPREDEPGGVASESKGSGGGGASAKEPSGSSPSGGDGDRRADEGGESRRPEPEPEPEPESGGDAAAPPVPPPAAPPPSAPAGAGGQPLQPLAADGPAGDASKTAALVAALIAAAALALAGGLSLRSRARRSESPPGEAAPGDA